MMKGRTSLYKTSVALLFFFSLPSYGLAYPAQGDWVISGVENIENQIIMLNGNLVVNDGGSLTIRKTNLFINNSYPGQFNIKVEPGGSLKIYDSTLKPSNLSYSFGIRVQEGSIVLSNNHIAGIGFIDQDDKLCPTVELHYVHGALISGNYITNVKSLVFHLQNTTSSEISDNIIETLEKATDPYPSAFGLVQSSNNTITNNTITGVYTGMLFSNQSSHNYVAFNSLTPGTAGHLGNGIYVDNDSNNNRFYGNTINGPTG